MTKILITGGFGYLGRYLSYYLNNRGYKIYIVDNLINGFKNKSDKFSFLKENFDSIKVKKLISRENIKIIIHLAAFIDSEESIRKPNLYFENNVNAFRRFLNNIKDFKLEKFIFASSAAVYGDIQKKTIAENDLTLPKSTYGLTKLIGENLLSDFNFKHQFSRYSLRFFNIVGCDNLSNSGPINKSYKHVFNKLFYNNIFYLNGIDYDTKDGTCERDFISTKNISNIIELIIKLKKDSKINHILNCGTGKKTSVKELAYNYKKIINPKLKIYKASRRRGDPVRVIANNKKLKKKISINFKNSNLNSVIKSYINWKIN